VCACRGRKNCPSGNSPASWCAARTARVVLPTPAIPPITHSRTTPLPAPAAASISSRSSCCRPVNEAISRGSVRVAAAAPPGTVSGDVPSTTCRQAASTSAAGPRPRAAARNKARTGSARPSASASSKAVSLRAVRLIPRSRSLTDRGLSPAASASSSWVSRASARSCRSNPANSSTGGCAIIRASLHEPSPRPPATRPGGTRLHQQYIGPVGRATIMPPWQRRHPRDPVGARVGRHVW